MPGRAEIISDMLYDAWDPLGVAGMAPRDEYADYARVIDDMLSHDASERTIAAYLSTLRARDLLAAPDRQRDHLLARMILRLVPSARGQTPV